MSNFGNDTECTDVIDSAAGKVCVLPGAQTAFKQTLRYSHQEVKDALDAWGRTIKQRDPAPGGEHRFDRGGSRFFVGFRTDPSGRRYRVVGLLGSDRRWTHSGWTK